MARTAQVIRLDDVRPGRSRNTQDNDKNILLDVITYAGMLDNLRARIIKSSISFKRLAELSGVGMQTIARFVKGDTHFPYDYTVERINMALGSLPRFRVISNPDQRILEARIRELKRQDRNKKRERLRRKAERERKRAKARKK